MFVERLCHVRVLTVVIKGCLSRRGKGWRVGGHRAGEDPSPQLVFVSVSGCEVSVACRWGSDAVFQASKSSGSESS